jgi:hypothetical protein
VDRVLTSGLAEVGGRHARIFFWPSAIHERIECRVPNGGGRLGLLFFTTGRAGYFKKSVGESPPSEDKVVLGNLLIQLEITRHVLLNQIFMGQTRCDLLISVTTPLK